VNLFLYAAGKSDWRNRLSSPYVAAPKGEPMGKVAVARVKYDGNWDPEPGAWGRFGRMFQWQTQFGVETRPVEMKDLAAGGEGPGVAHLTGTEAVKFTDAEVAAVKKFVEDGGVLLVDACGGAQAFNDSVRDALLGKAFPGVTGEKLPQDHPILRPAGEKDSLTPKVRAFVADASKDAGAGLSLIKAGKGFVVVSPLDVTTGLVGANAWGVAGYEPTSAQAIVRNVLLWAHGRQEGGQ